MDTVLYNTHDMVLFITIYQCFLFAIFLLTFNKGRKSSNVLLAGFLVAYACLPLDTMVQFGAAFKAFALDISPNLYNLFQPVYWLYGPLLLFYVRSMVYKDYKITRFEYLLLAPFVYFVLDYVFNWVLVAHDTKIDIVTNQYMSEQSIITTLTYTARELFRTLCTALALMDLLRYQRQIRNEFSDIEQVDLNWLKLMVIGFLTLHVLSVLTNLSIISSFELNIPIPFGTIGLVANYVVLLLISSVIFFSLRYPSIFNGIEIEEEAPAAEPQETPVDPEQIRLIVEFMDKEKPYLNHLLRLESLATQLQMSPRHLSNIINRHFEKSFFEFINTYRIDESKRLLLDKNNRSATMLDIMDQAGFNSKATFNTLFKKTIGMTPTQFRKEQIAKDEGTTENA